MPDLHLFRVHPVVVIWLWFRLLAAQAGAQAVVKHCGMDAGDLVVTFVAECVVVVWGGVFKPQCGVVLGQ
jgi:hypothetical protein